MEGLLVIERIVLESLSRKEKTLPELAADTTLPKDVVQNILIKLFERKLVKESKEYWFLERADKEAWQEVNHPQNVCEEVLELAESWIHKGIEKKAMSSTEIRLKKVALSKEEFKRLQGHFKAIELFVENVLEERSRRPQYHEAVKTADKIVLLWGQSRYGELLPL